MPSLASVPIQNVPYANQVDAYIPELWAMESIAVLEENTVIAGLIHRDFEEEIKEYGDVVNTRKPHIMKGKRKTDEDDIIIQNAVATNVQVPLNQHIHASFVIRDGQLSKSFKDLVTEFLKPAMLGDLRTIDRVLLGQAIHFRNNFGGHLNSMTTQNAKEYVLDTREVMNTRLAPMQGRNLIVTPRTETDLLKLDLFTSADKVGDEGTALREASLGRKLGFDFFMCQNATHVHDKYVTQDGTVDLGAGYPVGTVTLAVDDFVAGITNGAWLTIEGDGTPHRVLSTVGGSTPSSITLKEGLRRPVLDDAAIKIWPTGTVSFGAGYPAGYAKYLATAGFSVMPQIGQPISFGTQDHVYTIVDIEGTEIMLDRPLIQDVADSTVIGMGPVGSYNFAFTRNALALVSRPLITVPAGLGATSVVVNSGDLSVRVTMGYDQIKQGLVVTIDMLLGVAVLDSDLGAIMYA